MGKKWKCVVAPCGSNSFTVGKIYEEDENRAITGDDRYIWRRCSKESAVEWIHDEGCGAYKFEEVTDMFKKSDLKNGDVVQTENGEYFMYLTGGIYADTGTFAEVFCEETGWLDPKDYNEDLTERDAFPAFDIDKVFRPKWRGTVPLSKRILEKEYVVVYERKEATAKELSVAEIEKLLGYPVKIVKE